MLSIIRLSFILLLCITIAGCRHAGKYDAYTVDKIEEMIDSGQTDKALTILSSYGITDPEDITAAKLLLLQCKAMRQSALPISNAEGISKAIKIFHSADPGSSDEATAKYFKALSAYQAGIYPEAIIEASEASEFTNTDSTTIALCYEIISLCHSQALNTTSALAFARMAHELAPDNSDIIALNIDALTDDKKYDESLKMIDRYRRQFPQLARKSIIPAVETGDLKYAEDMFAGLASDSVPLSRTEEIYQALASAMQGKLPADDEILNEPKADRQYSLSELRLLDRLQSTVGNDSKVAGIRLMIHNMQDSVIVMLSESKIYQDLYNQEHIRRQTELLSARKARSQFIIVLVCIIAVALIMMGTMMYRRTVAAKRLAESESRIFALNEELNRGKIERENRQQEIAGMTERVNRLFKEHYESVEMAANLLLDASLSKNADKKIADQLNRRISQCRSREFLETLEATVNEYRNNAIERINTQIPDIAGQERVILLYCAAGLSTRVISLLTDLTPTSLYNKKYRLKKKIAGSGAKDTDEFLEMLK